LAPAAPPASEGWQRDGDAGRNKAGSLCPILKAEKRRSGWFIAPRKADFRLLS